MKRYEMVAWGGEGFMGVSEEGDWVEAEVAQELYDTVSYISKLFENDPYIEDDSNTLMDVIEMCEKVKQEVDLK